MFLLWQTLEWVTIGWTPSLRDSFMTPAPKKESEVVYRRTSPVDHQPPPNQASEPQGIGIAPTVTPIVIAFLLLLGLISGLGLLSAREMDKVAINAQDLVSRNSATQTVLLNLRLAITKLDNEARIENEQESRRELKPPLDVRFDNARDEVRNLLSRLEKPPLSEDPSWQQLRTDIVLFLEITE